MGTDVHGVLQVKSRDGVWRTECEMEDSRNYSLFAVLAGVRNGYGFAGVATHEEITSISKPRDLPKDFKVEDDAHAWGWGDPQQREWMGDHDHTWLTMKEVKDWPYWDTPVQRTGIIRRAQYETWDKKSPPDEYCGGRYGPGIVMADDLARNYPEGWTDIHVYWYETMREHCSLFWKWFAYVEQKYCWYGLENARIVIGFDS